MLDSYVEKVGKGLRMYGPYWLIGITIGCLVVGSDGWGHFALVIGLSLVIFLGIVAVLATLTDKETD